MITVLVTGGFDPIHSGHIAYLQAAAKEGTRLVVGVNSDGWLERKKGRPFMPWNERAAIVGALECVDEVISFNDDDGTAIDAIKKVKSKHPEDAIVFANGGDRTSDNIPEMTVDGVTFVFGVGGEDKKNSSSWILEEWKAPETQRNWGTYKVVHKGEEFRVKELEIAPLQSLSNQYHDHRDEVWNVVEGCVQIVVKSVGSTDEPEIITLKEQETYRIPKNTWHRAYNTDTRKSAKVIEIWFGDYLDESDITREEMH